MRAGWSSIERGRRILRSLVVIALVTSIVPLAAAAPAHAQDYMLGIDVSHHQGTIDWTKVAESGHVYVFQKATEGATFTDPTYARNRSGAGSVGIAFGAYHFAYAQGGSLEAARADAVSEANHFLAVAEPAAGDLLPVLDLEINPGDLPPRRLIAWTQAWLDTVAAALGEKPLIYTNPNFWATHMNDTTTFADQAFPLWIAHYTSATSPRVPASHWGGRGWAFWQWTSKATVPGISGYADENRYLGSDLSPYTIAGAPAPEPTPEPATPPSNTAPPEISGSPEVGNRLTATTGTWSGSEPLAYSYAWYRCGTDGADCVGVLNGTEPTYELMPGDYWHRMKVTVTATNSAGSAEASSEPSGVVVDTTPPDAPEMTKPLRANLLSTTIPVAWSSVEPNATYDVRYRKGPDGEEFGEHTPLVTGATETKHTLPAEVGASYCFSARTVDSAGNTSAWSSEICTVVALDDRDLRRSRGWVDRFGRAFYLDTFAKTKRRGSRLVARAVRTQEINLVAQRCPSCGRVAVEFNGERVGTVRLKAARIRNKRVIRVADLGSERTGKVVIVVLSRGAPVKIDGLSLFRGAPVSTQ